MEVCIALVHNSMIIARSQILIATAAEAIRNNHPQVGYNLHTNLAFDKKIYKLLASSFHIEVVLM